METENKDPLQGTHTKTDPAVAKAMEKIAKAIKAPVQQKARPAPQENETQKDG